MWNFCGSLQERPRYELRSNYKVRDHLNQQNDHLARSEGLIWVNDPESKCPPSGMVGGGRGERPRTTISFEQVQISKNSGNKDPCQNLHFRFCTGPGWQRDVCLGIWWNYFWRTNEFLLEVGAIFRYKPGTRYQDNINYEKFALRHQFSIGYSH